jgi:hypothetical protein
MIHRITSNHPMNSRHRTSICEPFFGAAHEAGFTEVVANLALAGSEIAGVDEWPEENEEALDRFFVWVEIVLD